MREESKSKEIQVAQFERATADVMKDSVLALAEGLTGLAASGKRDLILSVGRIFQGLLAGQFLSELLREWTDYKEKGRIKEDYQSTDQHKACLQELLTSLDNDSLDATRFRILKRIFLVAASETVSNRESYLPHEFMKIARSLTSGEVLVLEATYRVAKTDYTKETAAAHWVGKIAEESGLQYRELVMLHEDGLMRKNFLSPRQHADRSGVILGNDYRLTGLGLAFCRFIDAYQSGEESAG